MEIEFINHSAFVARSGDVSLACDPWIEGRAFNDGWDLISPTAFGYDDFASITHIWFSHEHPDHFAPANLRMIPESIRARIKVLYQQTADRKVVGFCEKLGFADVSELPLEQWVELGPDYSVICGAFGNGDSWMGIKAGGATLLNLNDCFVIAPEEAAAIKAHVGPVDVLATQFSLSSWEGNPEEVERRRAGARRMLDRFLFQARYFEAKRVLPFASFVWFCHEENDYINAEHNRVDTAIAELERTTDAKPLVMYPGDRWTVGEPHDSTAALARHVADFESLATRERVKARECTEAELMEAAEKFRASITEHATARRLELGLARIDAERAIRRLRSDASVTGALDLAKTLVSLKPRPARIYLWDLEQAYLFDLAEGLRPCPLARQDCDVAMGADSLAYAFKFLWGGESLQVNGRYHELYPDGSHVVFDYFHLAEAFNRGYRVPDASLTARVGRVLRSVAGAAER